MKLELFGILALFAAVILWTVTRPDPPADPNYQPSGDAGISISI